MSAASVPAVGIDLGTVYSVVAFLDQDGKPCTIPNAEGDVTTPSVVLFDATGVTVGKEAVKAARFEPDRVAAFAKRDMGEAHCARAIAGEQLPPEVVQSLVLQKLRTDAALMVGPFEKVVVTVPAYFNEPRRKATQDAGRIAGLDVIDIINEPTAAAIAFGVRHGYLSEIGEARQAEKILVYDLGGGTFDVTVMSIDGKSYETLATAGDVYLGGIDWDNRIADYLAEMFLEQHDLDPREDARARQRLLQEAEDAKRALTAREEMFINFDFGGEAVRTKLTRNKFVELTADLLDRTRFTAQKVLRDAGIQWSDLTRVLLVGGSTRMPMVREMLEKESGLRCDRSVSADEAVAHGAAIYAGILLAREAGERPQVSVTNVNSHDLGVLGIEPGTGRPRRKVLIPRNSPLPATHSSRFVTHTENQKTVAVPVIEGGDASGNNATPIGKCVVKNLPGKLSKGTNVVVNFTYTENGRLTVSATLPEIENAGATMTIERASGLSDEQIGQWQQRIAAGLSVGRETSHEDGEIADGGGKKGSKTAVVPEETMAEDLDATMWETDEDTIADDAAASEFLAVLDETQEKAAAKPEKPKPKRKEQPKKREKPKQQRKPQQPEPEAEPSEQIQIEGAPPVEDNKIDPDEDDALGDFLSGLT